MKEHFVIRFHIQTDNPRSKNNHDEYEKLRNPESE